MCGKGQPKALQKYRNKKSITKKMQVTGWQNGSYADTSLRILKCLQTVRKSSHLQGGKRKIKFSRLFYHSDEKKWYGIDISQTVSHLKKSVLFVFAVYSIQALFLCMLSKGRKYLKRQQSLSPFAQLKPMFRMLHSSHLCNARKQYPNASTFSVPWFHQHGPYTKDVWTLNTCKSPTVSILGCTV